MKYNGINTDYPFYTLHTCDVNAPWDLSKKDIEDNTEIETIDTGMTGSREAAIEAGEIASEELESEWGLVCVKKGNRVIWRNRDSI